MKERVLAALKRRRKTTDTFRDDHGFSWDYMMAFRVYDENDYVTDLQIKYNMQYTLNQLLAGGMEFRLFYSLNVSGTRLNTLIRYDPSCLPACVICCTMVVTCMYSTKRYIAKFAVPSDGCKNMLT